MIKRCIETGLMYLCKTSSLVGNPYLYLGSGVAWLKHVKAHKSFVVTCIIGEYETKTELFEAGMYYSKLYDVVKSPNWANLTEERGNGGLIGTGQVGRHWKIRDTSNMKKPKTKTEKVISGHKRRMGKNNYQFKGFIKTPWGTFETKELAIIAAKIERNCGNRNVITDGNTIRKYLNNLDMPLNKTGAWRGKTPRELGFDLVI